MNTNLVENKRLSHLVGEDKQYDLVMMIMKTREEVGENRVTFEDEAGRLIYVDGNKGQIKISGGRCRKDYMRFSWDRTEAFIGEGINSNGYSFISLMCGGLNKSFGMHTIVAAALRTEEFLERLTEGEGLVVNHMNGCYVDNHIQNLEIITRPENSIHGAVMTALRKEMPELFIEVSIRGFRSYSDVKCLVLKDKYLSAKDCTEFKKWLANEGVKKLKDSNVTYSGKN